MKEEFTLRSESVWRCLRGAVCAMLIVYMIAPMIIVVVISFSSAPFLTFPPPGFSLQWYHKLFSNPAWLASLITSFKVMVTSGILATVLGTAAAVGISRARLPGASAVAAFLMAPLVVPVIIIAAALFAVFQAWGLYGTLMGLVLAHTVLTIPYVVSTDLAALRMVDDQLESAAMTLGATRWRAFRRITLPLIFPAVLSGLLFAMAVSFDEVIVSIFISTPTVRPVTVQMWSDVRGDVDPTIAAIGTLMFLFSLLVLLVESLLRRHGAAQDRLNSFSKAQ